ncbi:helix-turn-helix domain-containing protein [Pusillimonas sp. CC-YST705]|uniref:Helix-turn-helix domain-containing protein n=1 Tax=Mesopusillimonas faecipullorum TaxID=2755040 RepID=A0ABS8CD69_9BURK|nr:helix-turn-helix domain-containing protein [Mesopusillimonas faecipullorum]MCB5363549.1 helix-turn-helix domain-containing protein [Mesopusillimonas faecipullorum]
MRHAAGASQFRLSQAPHDLRETLGVLQAAGESTSILILLDGDLLTNCAGAQLIITLYAECGVVSLLDDLSEVNVITALQSGADICCERNASPALLSSVFYSLLRRLPGARRMVPAPRPAVVDKTWHLAQQAWVLESLEGSAIALTTAERAFLQCLTAQAEMRATHEELIRAIEPGEVLPTRMAQGRLGVLVSRLRRKLDQQYGLELPVKSLHKWGYMFTGELRS